MSPLSQSSSAHAVPRTLQREWAARTHAGRRTEHNEDAFVLEPALGLFAVADGIGGSPAGEVASAMAVAVVREVLAAADRAARPPAGVLLTAAVHEANRRILAAAARDPAKKGMGTTFTGALALGARVVIAAKSARNEACLWLASSGIKTPAWLAPPARSPARTGRSRVPT